MTAPDTTSPVDRAALARLAEAATPGPWTAYSNTIRYGGAGGSLEILCEVNTTGRHGSWRADATFIAAAREAVPGLLLENERLREAAEAYVEAVESYLDPGNQ